MIVCELKGAIETAGVDVGQAAAYCTGDLGRMVDPAELAALIAVLASPQGAAISGAAISIEADSRSTAPWRSQHASDPVAVA